MVHLLVSRFMFAPQSDSGSRFSMSVSGLQVPPTFGCVPVVPLLRRSVYYIPRNTVYSPGVILSCDLNVSILALGLCESWALFSPCLLFE